MGINIRLLLLCINAIWMYGCTGMQCKIQKPAPPPVVERPILATSKITENSTNDHVVKMYRITIEQLISYSKQLEMILDTYKEQSK